MGCDFMTVEDKYVDLFQLQFLINDINGLINKEVRKEFTFTPSTSWFVNYHTFVYDIPRNKLEFDIEALEIYDDDDVLIDDVFDLDISYLSNDMAKFIVAYDMNVDVSDINYSGGDFNLFIEDFNKLLNKLEDVMKDECDHYGLTYDNYNLYDINFADEDCICHMKLYFKDNYGFRHSWAYEVKLKTYDLNDVKVKKIEVKEI